MLCDKPLYSFSGKERKRTTECKKEQREIENDSVPCSKGCACFVNDGTFPLPNELVQCSFVNNVHLSKESHVSN
jgi:hypothetical protein